MYKILLVEDYLTITEGDMSELSFLLPTERLNRIRHFRRVEDQKASFVAWLMLRHMLIQHFGIYDFELGFNGYGKPLLINHPSVYFNISHCRSGCLCGIADSPIGVDIQDITNYKEEVAAYACCADELQALTSAQDKAELFTKMWTIKESVLKMTGTGIGYGLKQTNALQYWNNVLITKRNNMIITAICEDRLGD